MPGWGRGTRKQPYSIIKPAALLRSTRGRDGGAVEGTKGLLTFARATDKRECGLCRADRPAHKMGGPCKLIVPGRRLKAFGPACTDNFQVRLME